MEKISKNKKDKKSKQRRTKLINTAEFVGTVKAFKNFDALAYQKSLREN